MKITPRVVANLVVFLVVFFAFLWWTVQNVVKVDAIDRPYQITGEFATSAGLAPGSEVAYLGVNYGRVIDVELCSPASEDPCEAESVRITMAIDRDRRIPEGSVARVFRKSPVGEPYIDFHPPDDFDPATATDDDYIQAGDEVALADTRTPLEFSELLRSFSDVLDNVDAEQAGIVIHELALALEGRAEDLRALTIAGDQLAATFADRTDALDRLAVNNTRLVEVFAEHRDALGSSVHDLGLLAESLRAASGDTRILLDRGTALLTEVGDLLADTRPELDCLLGDLVTVNDVAARPEQIDALVELVENGPAAFDLFWQTRDMEADGLWVRVALHLALENPAPQFVPPKELPAVPALPTCPGAVASTAAGSVGGGSQGSPVATGAADFDPATVLSAGGRRLPATGAVGALGAAGVAALLVLAGRRLRSPS